jgi:hypothetical protein
VKPAWGVDIAMRSFHAVRISDKGISMRSFVITPAKGRDRALTLRALGDEFAVTIWGESVYIEEPPLAGAKNLRTFKALAETAGALMGRAEGAVTYVPVSSWKKEVCGNGSLDKAGVARWLADNHPAYLDRCGGDQNLVDATCIALYGFAHENALV